MNIYMLNIDIYIFVKYMYVWNFLNMKNVY